MFDPPIRACIAEHIGQPERERDGDTLYKVEIKLIEYRPPKKKNVTKTPAGSSGSTQGSGGKDGKAGTSGLEIPDAIKQNQAEINRLTKQFSSSI
jgi:hypothetical protein